MGSALRIFLLALLCLAGLIAPVEALDRARLNEARPISEAELAELLQAVSRGRTGVSGARVDGGDFVVMAGGTEMRFGLARLSAQLNAEPDAAGRQRGFDSLLQKLDRVAASGDPSKPSPAEIARFREALLPVLKNRSYVEEFAALARKQGVPDGKLLHLPLAGDVIVVPAQDLPRITRFVSVGEGRRYGMSDEEILRAAFENLTLRVKTIEMSDYGGVRALSFDTDYNTSLLLAPEIWRSVPDLPANLVVALPARDILAFGDGDDPKAVRALRRIAAMSDGGYPVTRLLFRRVADRWQALER